MTVERFTWYSVDGSILDGNSDEFAGGFEWRITNTEEDAILRNQTDIEVRIWAKKLKNAGSYHVDSMSSYYSLTSGNVTNTVNIKTRTDFRDIAAGTYYAGSSYPLKVMSGTAVAKFTVKHNADGTAPQSTMTIRWTTNKAGSFGNGISASATLEIPTIPRATTPIVSPKTQACGSAVTIDLSERASDAFTHTLFYRLGSASGIIVSKTADTAYSWTIPSSLASQFATTSNSQTLVITCDTYQGNALIGSKQVSITVTLPAEYAPDITINSVTNLKGNNRFLQGIDGVQVNFSVTLKDGATGIKTAVLQIDGLTYNLQSPNATANLTISSQVISSSGTLTYTLTVTDNRGMKKAVTRNIAFTEYTRPSIVLYAKRDSNNPATVNITGNVSHDLAFKCYIDYRVRNTTSWATLATLSSTNNKLTISQSTELLLQAQAWEVRARVVDDTYGITTTRIVYVTAVVTYSEKKGGRAAAFFGPATDVPDGTIKVFGRIEAENVGEQKIQKILWSGGRYMTAAHTINLSEKVSEQDNGILLIFSAYQDGASVDDSFSSHFVPKRLVELMPACWHNFNLIGMFNNGIKYLQIYDNKIVGNDNNSGTRTLNGITYNNSYYVLRYVLGV